MTLEKAIEVLLLQLKTTRRPVDTRLLIALQLGISALESIQFARAEGGLLFDMKLPDETEGEGCARYYPS